MVNDEGSDEYVDTKYNWPLLLILQFFCILLLLLYFCEGIYNLIMSSECIHIVLSY